MRQIIDDKEFLVIAKTFLAEITKGLKKQKCLVFTPDNILITEKEIKKKKDFTFQHEARDITQVECLRLFGVILYHLARGQSEYTHEAYWVDPVDAYLNLPLPFKSVFWPVIAGLLKGKINTSEETHNALEKALANEKKKKETPEKPSPIIQPNQIKPFSIQEGGIIQLGTGLRTLEDLQSAFQDNGCRITDFTKSIIERSEFTVASKLTIIDLAVVSGADLGFTDSVPRVDIYARAQERGYGLCPPEVGPQLRLQYLDQPEGEHLLVGMEPIASSDCDHHVLNIEHDSNGLWLSCPGDYPHTRWFPGERWVFVRPTPKAFNGHDGGIIQLGTGLQTLEDFHGGFKGSGMYFMDQAAEIISGQDFAVDSKLTRINLVVVSGHDLGLTGSVSRSTIYRCALGAGYKLCPAELGPQLRLQYPSQPASEWLIIGMEPIANSSGDPYVFRVGHENADLWLGTSNGRPSALWDTRARWVFVRNKK